VRDFRIWWALFVFFAALSVLVVQQGYRRWQRVRQALSATGSDFRELQARRVRREGWRLACMALSVAMMTALVFAALLGAPPALLLVLRVVAVGGVAGVVLLTLSR
jgi:hypothetical protein